jgi:hypothetical protein
MDKSPVKMPKKSSQWPAQFLAAAEPARLGYTVAFTMGNHTPDADLMVGTQDGRQFWVDVKGQWAKGGWIIKTKAKKQHLFYILVLVGATDRKGDRFFILSQDEAG